MEYVTRFGEPRRLYSLPKLVSKPDTVFLEDPGNKTGSVRHDQAVFLFLTAQFITCSATNYLVQIHFLT